MAARGSSSSAPPPAADAGGRPPVSGPLGGGGLRGLGETFAANAVTGTATLSVPLAVSPGRGVDPELSLTYDSGAGQGPFGLGWHLTLPAITRRTDRGVPRYDDGAESDVFVLSGAEDLVPVPADDVRTVDHVDYRVRRYRPRVEGLFARIERWTRTTDAAVTFWRSISRDNITTWYGRTAESRIFDPADDRRIFSWLACESHDDKGNALAIGYRAEDPVNVPVADVHERHRTDADRTANRYPQRVRYGNTVPYFPVLSPDAPWPAAPGEWLFEVVLDYGDHDPEAPTPDPVAAPGWPCRPDPFSSYRSGFELRTYRRCQRVLMFHRFPELGDEPCLVRSTELSYTQAGAAEFTQLAGVTQAGHRGDPVAGYATKALPAVTFDYAPATLDPTVRTVPGGPAHAGAVWVDLDSEGAPGLLTRHRGAWHYQRNLSLADGSREPRFAARTAVDPAPTGIVDGTLVDLAGDGDLDLVRSSGFAPRTGPRDWGPFVPFPAAPTDPPPQLVDLTGDGTADLVLLDGERLRWHQALGAGTFDPARSGAIPDGGAPATVRFADVTGDGMPDLVAVGNGTACYWPNLGHGRFGSKVTMADAPWFDAPDLFDPDRLLLVDADGSGLVDAVYLAGDGARLYVNRSGDGWSPATAIPAVPGGARAVDLLGTGTPCLVWSEPRSPDTPLRYVDLLADGKPHLLTGYANGTGLSVEIAYQPSTFFARTDAAQGRPWRSRLPFPVHCVHRVTVSDAVRDVAFTSETSYHDGHYDPVEREFRGFARVDQLDTADYTGDDLDQAPVLTRTWYHTGLPPAPGEPLLHRRRDEYFANPTVAEHALPEPFLPTDLTAGEYREACRALKGALLRQEVYGLDGTPDAAAPYTATEATHAVDLVQERGANRHACFLVTAAETISYQYDRDPADPRTAHTLVLETDELGLVVRSADVAYPRHGTHPDVPPTTALAQAARYIAVTEHDHTADRDEPDAHRIRVAYETRAYELHDHTNPATGYLTADAIRTALDEATDIDYAATPGGATVRRLLTRSQNVFLTDDLAGPAALGVLPKLALGHESYQLALTAKLVTDVYGAQVTDSDLTAAGYVHRGDDDWWVPSGHAVYDTDAQDHFYQPRGFRDARGAETSVERLHDLLVTTTTDPLQTVNTAEYDLRLLAPDLATDGNGNRVAIEYDELGIAVATAALGKTGLDSLADPTIRIEYDLFRWQTTGEPNVVRTYQRERHGAANTGWQERHTHLDGAGTPLMVKTPAPPGPGGEPRWIGSGRTVLNNKGAVVRQFEPYFATTADYDSTAVGVSARTTYDPIGRVVRIDLPDGTIERQEHGAWRSARFDGNDTVLDSTWYAERGSPDPAGPEPTDPQERAAWLAAAHAGTPATTHTDPLGRVVLAVEDAGAEGLRYGRIELDLSGRFRSRYDARDRLVDSATTDLLGATLWSESAERGARWALHDVLGNPVRVWDEHDRVFETSYDELHRPLAVRCTDAVAGELAVSRVVYGERHPQAADRNLVGRVYQAYDQVGVATVERYDVDGNPEEVGRRFALSGTSTVDWDPIATLTGVTAIANAAAPLLEARSYDVGCAYDALGRPLWTRLPEGTFVEPTYDVANRLSALTAQIRGQGAARPFLTGQTYNARGQRLTAHHGNGVLTDRGYDPLTFRLAGVVTRREADSETQALQRLAYTYDPVGNVTHVSDAAQQTHFFGGAEVGPDLAFTYDPLYQLRTATGREHATAAQPDAGDIAGRPLPHPNDVAAVRRYTETFGYDGLGNLTSVRHTAGPTTWVRRYRYRYEDDPADRTNRLAATSVPGDDPAGPYSALYDYDDYGNMSALPHLPELTWSVLDQLQSADLGGGGTAFYAYGPGGQRMRTVIQRGGLTVERRFLGPVEYYQEWMNGVLRLERQTVHISDEAGRIAQVDTTTVDTTTPGAPVGTSVIRYQYGNHLGSAVVETDVAGLPISYEEYHPFGTTAYRSSQPSADLSLKRYRFAGQHLDAETGLYRMGVRYYAPWLGRWTSPDPAGLADGTNLFRYCDNDPVGSIDPSGTQSTDFHVVQPGTYTGNESFEELREAAGKVSGYAFDPTLTPENYRERWEPGVDGGNGGWNILVETGSSGEGESSAGSGFIPRGALQPPPEAPLYKVSPTAPIDLPQAPAGTNFRNAESAGRTNARTYYANQGHVWANGEQAQHYLKWREGQRTNLDPNITNDPRRMGPIQSYNKNSGGQTWNGNGSTFRNPHKWADRGLYFDYYRRIQQRWGKAITERVAHAEAGRAVQRDITGSPGPRLPYIWLPTALTFGGNTALTLTRGLVPYVAEAEAVLLGGSIWAYGHGYAAAGSALGTAGAYVAPAAGGFVAGSFVGGTAGAVVRANGGGRGAQILAGVASGMAAGALVGALIGTVLPGAGNVAGWVIGGVVGAVAGGIGGLIATW
ncbi:RHS repeat-associated core domain-containing protein [Asanoa hainanensis]|uniref:RHS repeat-associated core domain-containing protein n=1 Tax=Asanoa hainanensis TaxID=560556 RepID=A0A239N486_9ACTN|nr:SpvB/TcaC N-terminal domain-containing protein [Asanoa hainanensis]SNT49761.1 RHS repeat-associated core domain-containing protein [Asanoa hainanensis]